MKKLLLFSGLLIFFLGACSVDNITEVSATANEYSDISAEELSSMLEDKDFFLLDVHIPEQEHIDGTDAFIPYNDISSYISDLPEDKDEQIVVYCRSGSMSRSASQELIDLGYSNILNLEGGIQAYNRL